jgi:alkylation response protein AidB-like acyl-CoA dehydrogenase
MFTVTPIFDSEFHDSASRFAKDAEIENSGLQQAEDKKRFHEKKWRETIDLGWPACLIPAEDGGLGGTVIDFCALLEGTATHALPLSLSAGMGLPAILLSALNFENKASLLSAMAEGSVRLQPIYQPLDPFLKQMSHEMTLQIKTVSNATVLDGKVTGVEHIPQATHYLLCCSNQDGSPSLWLIPTTEISPVISHEIRIDSRDSLSLTFNAQPLREAWCIASGPSFSAAYDRMFNFGALFSCVEAVSSMGTALEQTIRYLSERQQFGVTLSTFQVLRHDLANVYAKYESIRALVCAFTRKVSDTGVISEREISLLKIYLSQVGPKLAHTVIQVHGGMGMTEELWATRLNKRILMTSLEYGDGQFHSERAHTLQKMVEQHA